MELHRHSQQSAVLGSLNKWWCWHYHTPGALAVANWVIDPRTLANIHPNFAYCGVSDRRLNPDSDLQYGCRGVAILWKKCIIFSTIPVNDCDRISGISIPLNDQWSLSILSVYMPSANHTSDEYSSCLNAVEHLISQLTAVGPLIVAGDINAHIGSADGGQAPNNRGGMWNSLIDEYSLFTMLQLIGCQYSGPSCTYASGGRLHYEWLHTNEPGWIERHLYMFCDRIPPARA